LFDAGSGSTVADVSGVEPPLDLTIGNMSAVTWLPDGGLDVNSSTIIQSGSPVTRLFNALTTSNELTLEAWIIPESTQQDGPARILTLSEDPLLRNFTLGQEFDAFEIRLRTTTTDDNGFPPLASPDGGATTNLSHVVYTRRANGQAVLYINNNVVANETRDGNFSNWDNQYELALANELTEDRPWLGTFHLVAIFDRDLSAAEVNQNYQAGPHPAEPVEPGSGIDAYVPVVVSEAGGGCGQSQNNRPIVGLDNETAVETGAETAVQANADNTGTQPVTDDGILVTIFWLIGLVGALLVVGLGAFGIYNSRTNLQS
jgi:hypothetical protein